MKPTTAKRVVLYRFDRDRLEGIVNPSAYLLESALEVLSSTGALVTVPYADVKALCFVSETGDPRLFSSNIAFERRPRTPGLWVRFTFRDADQLEGILSSSLLDWPAQGFLLTPPFVSGLRQRVFVPRSALAGTELRGVIGAAGEKKAARPKTSADQLEFFGSSDET